MVVSNLRARSRRAAPDAARGRAALTIGAVALATAGLAACSSSSGPAAELVVAGGQLQSGRPGQLESGRAGRARRAAGSLDVCTAVTTAQVGTAMGATVETTTGSVVDGNSCLHLYPDHPQGR